MWLLLLLLPLQVLACHPDVDRTQAFYSTQGWTGGDAAYSIPCPDGRVLWLFGDTFIGRIADGRRVDETLVNNTMAWQVGRRLQFVWRDGPAALLRPPQADEWYWPGDGTWWDGHLFIFCKSIEKAAGPPGLDFRWVGSVLLEVRNPDAAPSDWQVDVHPVPTCLGTACRVDGDDLYVYGDRAGEAVLARLHPGHLESPEFWTATGWRLPDGRTPGAEAEAAPLFDRAAAEMSVCRIPGMTGWFAVYTEGGLGPDIVMRQAPRLEGPWGPAVPIYHCPDPGSLMLYAAKAHPEQDPRPGRLVVTYCRNLGRLEDHRDQPFVYFPQALDLQLALPGR